MKKSEALIRDLKEKLKLRLPSTYVFSAPSNDVIVIQQDSAWATTEQKVVIKIKAEVPAGTDAIGLAAVAYSPHVCQIAAEESATAGASVLSDLNQSIVMFEVSKLGCAIEWYLEAAASEPVVGSFVPAKLKFKLDDLRFPLTGV